MSDKIEARGKTVKDAVNEALLRMGARQDEVKITVIEEPKSGFLGLGGRQAKVLVEKKPGRGGGGRRDFREKDDNYSPHALSDGKSGGGRRRGRRGGKGGGQDGDAAEGQDRQESRGGRSRGRRGGRSDNGDRTPDRQEAGGDTRQPGGDRPEQGEGRSRGRRRGRRSGSQDQAATRNDDQRPEARNEGQENQDRQESRGRSRGRRGGRGRGRGDSRGETRQQAAEVEVNGNHHDNGPEKQLSDVTAREARGGRPRRRGRRSGGRGDSRPEGRPAAEVAHDAPAPEREAAPRTREPRERRDNHRDNSRDTRDGRDSRTQDIPDVTIVSAVKADAYAAPLRDVAEDAVGGLLEELTTGVLARGGFPCRTNVTPDEYYQVRVITDDASAGMLIGRHGATIDAVEHLIDRMAGMAAGDRVRLNLDINNYRRRRSEVLHERVAEAIAKVNEGGRAFHMEPMCARERRIVHLAAEGDPSVKTFTMSGSGEKHVVIAPADEPRVEDDREDPVAVVAEGETESPETGGVEAAPDNAAADLPELDDYTEVVETEAVPGEPDDFGEDEFRKPPSTEA